MHCTPRHIWCSMSLAKHLPKRYAIRLLEYVVDFYLYYFSLYFSLYLFTLFILTYIYLFYLFFQQSAILQTAPVTDWPSCGLEPKYTSNLDFRLGLHCFQNCKLAFKITLLIYFVSTGTCCTVHYIKKAGRRRAGKATRKMCQLYWLKYQSFFKRVTT